MHKEIETVITEIYGNRNKDFLYPVVIEKWAL